MTSHAVAVMLAASCLSATASMSVPTAATPKPRVRARSWLETRPATDAAARRGWDWPRGTWTYGSSVEESSLPGGTPTASVALDLEALAGAYPDWLASDGFGFPFLLRYDRATTSLRLRGVGLELLEFGEPRQLGPTCVAYDICGGLLYRRSDRETAGECDSECRLSFSFDGAAFTTELTNFPAALPRPMYRCQQLAHEYVMRRYHAACWRERSPSGPALPRSGPGKG